MEVVPVEEKLRSAGLLHPKLSVLQADDTLYTVLALQPEGRIRIAESFIGNADAVEAKQRMSLFMQQVGEMQPDLVVCPEYSVPWEVLIESIEAGVVPSTGKLWVVGCESLLLKKLEEYRERLAHHAIILDDDVSTKERTTQQYRNPLTYVFKTLSEDGRIERLVLLVQYKTVASGDPGNTEATGMLPGKNVYLFGRAPEEVRLMTLICSDVFSFGRELITQHYQGLLLLHIQLNNNPLHITYKRYRQELFEFAGDTEVLCLNWADNIISFQGDGKDENKWKNIGRSAWYLIPPEMDLSDEGMNENHRHGVYYTRHHPIRTHALQFHYRPRAFLLQSTKVIHHGIPKPRSSRTGPRALKTFIWSSETLSWIEAVKPEHFPDDGFRKFLDNVPSSSTDLTDVLTLYESCPTAVERLFAVSAGEFGPDSKWYYPSNIDSMRLCEQEIVRRVTITQDPEQTAVNFRSTRFGATRFIAELRTDRFSWPAPVENLRNGFNFHWSHDVPNRNVVAADGTYATIVHAGMQGDHNVLDVIDQRVRKTLAGQPPEPDRALSDKEKETRLKQHLATKPERLCILYSTATGTKHYGSERGYSFTAPAAQSAVDYTVPSFHPNSSED